MFRLAFSFYVFVLAGLIATVNVSEASGPLEIRNVFSLFKRRITIAHHNKRQTTGDIPDVPPECKSDCDPVTPILTSNSCTVGTCCTTSFEMNYFNCFKCLEDFVNVTDFSEPQQIVDALINDCASEGVALPKLTFPGQNPNRGLSSVVSRKASTAPLSFPQTAISAASSPTSAIQQTTITAISTTPSSSISEVSVTAPPSSASSIDSAASPTNTNTSAGVKSAGSRLASGMSTVLLWACFYFAL